MKVELKMGEILSAYTALQRLDLPAPIALKVMRAARPLEAEIAAYEQQRLRLVQKYGKQDGQQMKVGRDSEEWPLFASEVQELLEVDVAVEIEPLSIDILGQIKIAPAVLSPILFLWE